MEEKIGKLQIELSKFVVDVLPETEDITTRLQVLRKLMEKDFDFLDQEVPEDIIDAFVNQIIVHKDYFEWNLKMTERPLYCKVDGTKRKSEVVLLNETSSFCGGQHRRR